MPTNRESQLPSITRRPKRRDWGQGLARFMCAVFAIIGILPIGLSLVVRSEWLRGWALRETSRLLASEGITATYKVEVSLWPLAVSVVDLHVASGDGGAPLATADRIVARPKFFGLLSGKLAIDQIEVDSPRVRLVLRDGEITNLPFKIPKTPKKVPADPFHAPFSVIAVTDADLDLDLEGILVKAQDIDLDVTADDDPRLGSSFEAGATLGATSVRRSRTIPAAEPGGAATVAVDEDTICALEGRVRIEPHAIVVRRLTVTGAADLDPAAMTAPSCDLAQADKRRVEVSLARFRVDLPEKEGELPKRVSGHVRARAPLAIAARFVSLPGADGWVSVDADVRHAEDTQIPDVGGHISVRDVQIAQFKFAKEIDTEIYIRKNVITSPKTVVKIAEGTATLTDTVVEPLTRGIPIRTTLEAHEIDFTALMRDLGVSDHAHVQWDIHELKVPSFAGTIEPLKLDGDLSVKTANFAVFDKARDDKTRARLVGFREAEVTSRVSVRAAALEFKNVRAVLPGSVLEQGFCSIGFHNDLIVDVPKGHVDLADITPIATIEMHGIADVDVHLKGKMDDPVLEADLSIAGYVLGDIPFGDVTAAHARFSGTIVDLERVVVRKGKSQYEVKAARLDFGAGAGVIVDATAGSDALSLRDFFAIFKMEDDPRFEQLNAEIATRATVHVALGGPEDVCGDGYIEVRAGAHLKKIDLFGETFDDGDVNLVYRWTDRRAGIAGADIEVRSLVVHKAVIQSGKRTLGSILGSATIQRGGTLAGGVVLESIPLGRLQSLGTFAKQVDGSVSGFARVSGTIDAFRVESELDVTPIRLHGIPFGGSRAHLTMTQSPPTAKPIGKTRCGGDIAPEFDKDAYLRDDSPQGQFVVDGSLLGGQLVLQRVAMTRQKSPHVSGQVAMRGLDLGALLRVMTPKARDVAAGDEIVPEKPLKGELSGDLTITELRTDDLAHAYVRFVPTAMFVERDGQRISLRPGHAVLKFSHDMLNLPELVFDIRAQGGLTASFALSGNVIQITRDPEGNLDLVLAPVNLALLVGVVPRLEEAAGKLEGSVHVTGKARDPNVDGQLHLRGGEFAFRGSPSVLSEVELDVQSTASEVRVTRGSAKFAGGTVDIRRASIPLRDFSFGAAEAEIVLEDIPIAGIEGVSGAVSARLLVSYKPTGTAAAQLPKISGDVTINSFEYTRAVNLASDLTAFGAKSLGVRSSRTVVETYDPSLDAVAFDLRIRSRTPLRLRNNLVDAQLRIDSGALAVTGTNQRFGLRGDLRAVSGGRFHFRNSDFEIRQGLIRFDDPTRILPKVDVIATTEYRRYQEAGSSRAGAGGTSSGRTAGFWRITLHAYGEADSLSLDMTSEPALSREDIALLLSIGITRAEVDQLQAGSVGAGFALEALATVSGADRAVKAAVPVIDDFRFGTAYSPRAGRTVPQVSVGKRLTENVRAQVTTGITSEDRELRSNIEWRLGQRTSVLGSYDNINSISASPVGNLGVDLRWRLEFE